MTCLLMLGCLAFQAPRPHVATSRRRSADEPFECQPVTGRQHKDVIAKDKPREGWIMATRALRGEYDPPEPEADTERSSLLGALVEYPTTYGFTAVGKLDGSSPNDFRRALARTLQDECGILDVESTCTERLNGRFASVHLTCRVDSPDTVRTSCLVCITIEAGSARLRRPQRRRRSQDELLDPLVLITSTSCVMRRGTSALAVSDQLFSSLTASRKPHLIPEVVPKAWASIPRTVAVRLSGLCQTPEENSSSSIFFVCLRTAVENSVLRFNYR